MNPAIDFDLAPPAPVPDPGEPWQVRSAGAVGCYTVSEPGVGDVARLAVSRAVHGPWRHAFPVGTRDIIVTVAHIAASGRAAAATRAVTGSLTELDPACRRVIAPCPMADLVTMSVLEDAGFTFVTDTDTAEGTYGLLLFGGVS